MGLNNKNKNKNIIIFKKIYKIFWKHTIRMDFCFVKLSFLKPLFKNLM